jgi:hypothetical protein
MCCQAPHAVVGCVEVQYPVSEAISPAGLARTHERSRDRDRWFICCKVVHQQSCTETATTKMHDGGRHTTLLDPSPLKVDPTAWTDARTRLVVALARWLG